MSLALSVKHRAGASRPRELNLTGLTYLPLPEDGETFSLTGTVTLGDGSTTPVIVGVRKPGRRVTFISASGTQTFKNTNGPTTEGYCDLDGADVALDTISNLELIQRDDGHWELVNVQIN